MTAPTLAPCGTWRSPITAARVAAGTRPLTAPRIAGGHVRWLEGLPDEGGRVAVVERAADGTRRVLTPAPFNVRSRVHEYGGGAWCTDGTTIWFSHFGDHGVYEQRVGEAPRAVTSDGTRRHADFELDAARGRLLAVCEDHGVLAEGAREPRNRLVALALADGRSTTLAEGDDFYAAPRLAPEGRRLAWLSWRHPRMPWEGTELWLAAIADDGTLTHVRHVAGGPDESIMEPCWAPDGHLYCLSDRSGWWNLHRVDAAGLVPVLPMTVEFGAPLWSFAPAHYGFTHAHEVIAACSEGGRSRLLRIDVQRGTSMSIDTSFDDITELRVDAGKLVLLAGAGTLPTSVVSLPASAATTQDAEVLARSAD
ncbi:MAG TPA: S9 family peptidase, partial [Burkholderiaceae bacterium]|nr:S9 family peptidase [Burkholderiaceae bacterium]